MRSEGGPRALPERAIKPGIYARFARSHKIKTTVNDNVFLPNNKQCLVS